MTKFQPSPHADLRVEPFSRRGSYLSLRRYDETTHVNRGLRGILLRQHHGNGFLDPLLATLRVDGAEPESVWDEGRLDLYPAGKKGGSARVEIIFDGTRALRLWGTGCSLSLEFPVRVGSSMYPFPLGGWEINVRPAHGKIQLTALHGEMEAEADWQGENSRQMVAHLRAGPEGFWELALDFFVGTLLPRSYRPRAELEAEVRADFAAFLAGCPDGPEEFAAARVRAAYVNWSALVEPSGHFLRPAMLMSKNHMANVWSWDHAFNALAHFPGDPELAWDQMLLMADRQNEHGAFPDAQNDLFEHFNFCKPPIHGWAIGRMRKMRPDWFTGQRVRETIAWLEPWTRWWLNHRWWKGEDLPYYLHGNDSGWDNSTFFLRGVPVLTPDLPCFLVLQCRELAQLHAMLGETMDERFWHAQADRLKDRLLTTLWDGEHFYALRMPQREKVEARTLIETVPLVLGDELPEDIRTKLVGHLQCYRTDYGLATEDPASEHYTPDGYWRGPIWAPSTYLIIDGLRRGGEGACADELAQRYVRMCAASGFAENFDALTGAPLRDRAYTWTSSVFLLLLSEMS